MKAALLPRLELAEGTPCEWCDCGDPAVGFMIDIRLPICDAASRSLIKIPKPPKPAPRPGFIYFIQAGDDGPVKIGWSVNPFGRLAFFQTGHWETLRIVREFPGTVPEERRLHQRFAEYQIRNEWFDPIVLDLAEAPWGHSAR